MDVDDTPAEAAVRTEARAWLATVLSRGDSDDPDALIRAFLGRDPEPGALLERNLGPEPA